LRDVGLTGGVLSLNSDVEVSPPNVQGALLLRRTGQPPTGRGSFAQASRYRVHCPVGGAPKRHDLFKEGLIYEQSAVRTVGQRPKKQWCHWTRQLLKIEQLPFMVAASVWRTPPIGVFC
jgi:hypothetical protein